MPVKVPPASLFLNVPNKQAFIAVCKLSQRLNIRNYRIISDYMNIFKSRPAKATLSEQTRNSTVSKIAAGAALTAALVFAFPPHAASAVPETESYTPATISVLDVVPNLEKGQTVFAGISGNQYSKPGDGYSLEFVSTKKESIIFKVYTNPDLSENAPNGHLMGEASLKLGHTVNITPSYWKYVKSSDAMPPAGSLSISFTGVKMHNGVPGAVLVFGYTAPEVKLPILNEGVPVKKGTNSEIIFFGTSKHLKEAIVAAHDVTQSTGKFVILSLAVTGENGTSAGQSQTVTVPGRMTGIFPTEGSGVSVYVGNPELDILVRN